MPFLSAVAIEGVQDVRPLLSPYIGKDSSELVADYRAKVMKTIEPSILLC